MTELASTPAADATGDRTLADYEIVRYTPALKDGVLQLQTHLWSPDISVNRAHFDWKYEQNPYLQTTIIHLALYRGTPVGMRASYGAKWQIGQPALEFLAPVGADLVVAPGHRRRGLAQMMTRASVDELAACGYEYSLALGGNPDAYPIASSVGSIEAVSLETVYRRAERAILRHAFSRWGVRIPVAWRLFIDQPASRVFSHLDRKSQTRGRHAGRRVSVELAPRTAAMVELIDRLGHDGRIRHVRDQEYLAWRFRNPLSTYRFLFVGESRLEGYLVLQASSEGLGPAVNIVDWEASDDSVRADLLRAVIDWGAFEDLRIWSATISTDERALLRRSGFRFPDSGGRLRRAYRPGVARQRVGVRAVTEPIRKQSDWLLADRRILDSANWDLRMIYSDDY